ncbi:hypothetical protein HGM15179_015058 [Zosterops borbonicus]|uniref:Uncharacterized protein n=1 Tax=Zosterops borbonicus TaxID=364589 RepID=A0A8K1LFG2_9PASS|nr:hypothetical protein HGM15179_015058 [Zosterops borbonicus]
MKKTKSSSLFGSPPLIQEIIRGGQNVIQWALDRLEEWAYANLIKLNNARYKVLSLSQSNIQYQQRLGDEWIESSPTKKDLGMLVNEKLDMTHQCTLSSHEASWTSKEVWPVDQRMVISPSTPLSLNYTFSTASSSGASRISSFLQERIVMLKWVQWWVMKKIKGL